MATDLPPATYQISRDGEPIGEPFGSETEARAFAEEQARADGWPGEDMDFQWWNADQADWKSPLHLYAVCDGHDDQTGYVITRIEQPGSEAAEHELRERRRARAARAQKVAEEDEDRLARCDDRDGA